MRRSKPQKRFNEHSFAAPVDASQSHDFVLEKSERNVVKNTLQVKRERQALNPESYFIGGVVLQLALREERVEKRG